MRHPPAPLALLLLLACTSRPADDDTSTTSSSDTGASSSAGTSTPTTGDPASTTSAPTSTAPPTTEPATSSSTTTATTTGSTTTDATTTTTDATTGAAACASAGTSTLPGVRICFPAQPQQFTLAEAQAGLEFHYSVEVDADIADIESFPGDAGGCDDPAASGLFMFGIIQGGDEQYCVCDSGLCRPPTDPPFTLKAGVYEGTYAWNGVNWNGPSDTQNPFGPPFPPGEYTLTIQTRGAWPGDPPQFLVDGQLPITLVP